MFGIDKVGTDPGSNTLGLLAINRIDGVEIFDVKRTSLIHTKTGLQVLPKSCMQQ